MNNEVKISGKSYPKRTTARALKILETSDKVELVAIGSDAQAIALKTAIRVGETVPVTMEAGYRKIEIDESNYPTTTTTVITLTKKA